MQPPPLLLDRSGCLRKRPHTLNYHSRPAVYIEDTAQRQERIRQGRLQLIMKAQQMEEAVDCKVFCIVQAPHQQAAAVLTCAVYASREWRGILEEPASSVFFEPWCSAPSENPAYEVTLLDGDTLPALAVAEQDHVDCEYLHQLNSRCTEHPRKDSFVTLCFLPLSPPSKKSTTKSATTVVESTPVSDAASGLLLLQPPPIADEEQAWQYDIPDFYQHLLDEDPAQDSNDNNAPTDADWDAWQREMELHLLMRDDSTAPSSCCLDFDLPHDKSEFLDAEKRRRFDKSRSMAIFRRRATLMLCAHELAHQTGCRVAVVIHYNSRLFEQPQPQHKFRLQVYASPNWRDRICSVGLLYAFRRTLSFPPGEATLPVVSTLGYLFPPHLDGQIGVTVLPTRGKLPTGYVMFHYFGDAATATDASLSLDVPISDTNGGYVGFLRRKVTTPVAALRPRRLLPAEKRKRPRQVLDVPETGTKLVLCRELFITESASMIPLELRITGVNAGLCATANDDKKNVFRLKRRYNLQNVLGLESHAIKK